MELSTHHLPTPQEHNYLVLQQISEDFSCQQILIHSRAPSPNQYCVPPRLQLRVQATVEVRDSDCRVSLLQHLQAESEAPRGATGTQTSPKQFCIDYV